VEDVDTIKFSDGNSGQEALAIVRAGEGYIALCLSLSDDGDVEVLMDPAKVERLIEALRQGASLVNTRTDEIC
jgi:hypothetical protein